MRARSCDRGEFFDLDKADYGLLPVHCEVWAGFIFVHLADEPPQSLREFLGPMIGALEGYPFGRMTERYDFRAEVDCNWKVFLDAFQEYYHVPVLHSQEATPAARPKLTGFEAPHYQLDGPHRLVTTSSPPRRSWPDDYQYRAALGRGDPFPRWLLVLDDAGSPEEIENHLPDGDGHIVITSGNPAWSQLEAERSGSVFDMEESPAYLMRMLTHITQNEALQVSAALGFIPLAVEQAAAFLSLDPRAAI